MSNGLQEQFGQQVAECANVCADFSLRTVEVGFEIFLNKVTTVEPA